MTNKNQLFVKCNRCQNNFGALQCVAVAGTQLVTYINWMRDGQKFNNYILCKRCVCRLFFYMTNEWHGIRHAKKMEKEPFSRIWERLKRRLHIPVPADLEARAKYRQLATPENLNFSFDISFEYPRGMLIGGGVPKRGKKPDTQEVPDSLDRDSQDNRQSASQSRQSSNATRDAISSTAPIQNPRNRQGSVRDPNQTSRNSGG